MAATPRRVRNDRRRRRPRALRAAALRRLAPACGLVLTACVTETVDADPARLAAPTVGSSSVVVPLHPDGEAPDSEQELARDAYYGSLLTQMSEAALEQDADLLSDLLRRHAEDPRAPDWVDERFERFAELVGALRFLDHARTATRIELPERADRLGEAIECAFVLPPGSHGEVVLSGEGRDRIAFRMTFSIVDFDCFGNRSRRVRQVELEVEDDVVLEPGGEPFRLATVVPNLPVQGVWRRVEVDLVSLPGRIRVDGRPAPVRRNALARARLDLFPPGTAVVREKPLAILRAAVARGGGPEVYRHVALAARELADASPAVRDEAVEVLIDWLRRARREPARVATAALREVTGAGISLDDRDAWLAWWGRRQRTAGR